MFSSDKWFGAKAGFYSETINQSLRFDGSGDLRKSNFSTPTNNQQWTWSAWVKLAVIDSGLRVLFQADTNSVDALQTNDNKLTLTVAGTAGTTTAKYRDTTNWYHVLFNYNGSKAYLYINNRLDLELTTSGNSKFNNSSYTHFLGQNGSNGRYWSGYMAEVNFIDGQALDPSSFGETKNGVWIPKNVSGLTYGNNGFRLTFADSSALGDDTSTNTNDFTVAGTLASTDVVLDSPTNNFCVFNALEVAHTNELTLSEGNLGGVPSATSAWNTRVGNFNFSSGKWYAEFSRVTDVTGVFFGILQTGSTDGLYIGYGSQGYGYYIENGNVQTGAGYATNGTGLGTATKFDVIGVALNLDDNELRFYKNGTVLGSSAISISDASYAFGASATQSGNLVIANFGQDSSFAGYITSGSDSATDENGQGDFFDAPPTGFLAMCAANIPDSTLSPNQDEQAEDHFSIVKYTGNGYPTSNGQTISGVGFQSDFTWIKDLDRNGYNHYLLDSSRGATKVLRSNVSNAEGTEGASLTSWNADGFVLGANNEVNYQNDEFVAWNWKANGGTTTTNDASATGVGDIDSVIQANTTAGFSIVTFTGNGSDSTNTIAHGLGAKPSMYIVKDRDTNVHGHMMVYHKDTSPSNHYNLFMSGYGTNASNNAGFGSSDPATTTTFKPAVTLYTNNSGSTYVAWLWTEIEGYSKFGTYNGQNGGNVYIHTGFRPAFFMCKNTQTAGTNWLVFDDVRDTANAIELELNWNNTDQQNDNGREIDFVSNGIKIRTADNNNISAGDNYIYMAFARQPFKFSNAF